MHVLSQEHAKLNEEVNIIRKENNLEEIDGFIHDISITDWCIGYNADNGQTEILWWRMVVTDLISAWYNMIRKHAANSCTSCYPLFTFCGHEKFCLMDDESAIDQFASSALEELGLNPSLLLYTVGLKQFFHRTTQDMLNYVSKNEQNYDNAPHRSFYERSLDFLWWVKELQKEEPDEQMKSAVMLISQLRCSGCFPIMQQNQEAHSCFGDEDMDNKNFETEATNALSFDFKQ